ncbi:hypothetical protein ACQZV8_20540, partial [Magnetococcales bacterium HHB-1]
MKLSKSTQPTVPFCHQGWKVPAVLLIALFFGTVAWGVHLMGDHEELLEGDILDGEDLSVQSLNPLRGIAMTTGLSVTDVAVRAALVNIAGMSRQKTYASVGSGVIVNPKGYVF